MGRERKTAPEGEQFARPITDLIADVEANYHVDITLSMEVSRRKGVLELVAYAVRREESAAARPSAKVALEWPNVSYTSMPGTWFRLMTSLARLVEEDRRDMDLRGDLWWRL